jgi:hypothetical protein
MFIRQLMKAEPGPCLLGIAQIPVIEIYMIKADGIVGNIKIGTKTFAGIKNADPLVFGIFIGAPSAKNGIKYIIRFPGKQDLVSFLKDILKGIGLGGEFLPETDKFYFD